MFLRLPRPIFPHGSRRYVDPELERELVRDTCLAPGWILTHHAHDQFPNGRWHGWSSRTGLPAPEQPETLAVPRNQGFGLDDHQGIFPVTESGPYHQTHSSVIGQRLRSDRVLSVEGQLFAQEEILSLQCYARSEPPRDEREQIGKQGQKQRANGTSGSHGKRNSTRQVRKSAWKMRPLRLKRSRCERYLFSAACRSGRILAYDRQFIF